MNRTLKAMSLLLSYPTEELKGEIGAIEKEIADLEAKMK